MSQDPISPPVQQRRLRLLIVDENETARAVAARRLNHYGHDVVLAEDGHMALSLLLSQKFDLVLIDMQMRRLSGLVVMGKMRASGLLGSTVILMVTPAADRAAAVEALRAGADDQIAKPFEFDVLDARIRHLVARAERIDQLSRHSETLDARLAGRAMELGETRVQLEAVHDDRARLLASIDMLNEELTRLRQERA